MNARQQKRFEERFTQFIEHEFIFDALQDGYSAACQDESEAVQGLVEALERWQRYYDHHSTAKAREEAYYEAEIALKVWKGE